MRRAERALYPLSLGRAQEDDNTHTESERAVKQRATRWETGSVDFNLIKH